MNVGQRSQPIKLMTAGVFFICVGVGFWLAYNRPMWNDEIYTIKSTVLGFSYIDIFLGKIGNTEGNQAPLFYLIQKAICFLTNYSFPDHIGASEGYADIRTQILLRINSVLSMALSITLTFYYFSRHYSIGAGLYSLLVSLSSFIVWFYWAEARPYALWFFLTTCQSLIFLSLIREQAFNPKHWKRLIVVHFLLCFTTVFSIIQIIATTTILWIVYERNWKKYIVLSFIPAVICSLYLITSPTFDFWFKEGFLALINASVPKDRLFIIFIFLVYLVVVIQSKIKLPSSWKVKTLDHQDKKVMVGFLTYFSLILIGCLMVLIKLKLADSGASLGFQVSNRYFICLAPVGIIAVTLFSYYLVRASHNKIIQGMMFVALGVLLIFRILRMYGYIGFPPIIP